MLNLKWAIVLGIAGLLLSLVIGLFSGIGFPHVFVRAGIMGGVFFALGCGLWLLINNFIPELLFSETNEERGEDESDDDGQFDGSGSGSHVNITIDDPQNLPEIFRNLDHGDEVGNIMDLVTGAFKPAAAPPPAASAPAGASFGEVGIDQNPQDGYTGNSSPSASPASSSPSGAPSGSPAGSASSSGLSAPSAAGSELPDIGGELGDLEGMAGFFGGSDDAGAAEAEEVAPPERRPSGNKSEKLEGDFNPKELAMGIRTVLSKDDK